MNYYLVESKSDDNGMKCQWVIYSTLFYAKQYYDHTLLTEDEALVLSKFLGYVEPEEEQKQTEDERFSGTGEVKVVLMRG